MGNPFHYSGAIWVYRARASRAVDADWREMEKDLVEDDETWEKLYWPIRENAKDMRMWDGWINEDYVFQYDIKIPIHNCDAEDALAAFCRAATLIGKWGYHFQGNLFCFEDGPDTTSRLFINERCARVYKLEETWPESGHTPTAAYNLVKEVSLKGNVDPNGQLPSAMSEDENEEPIGVNMDGPDDEFPWKKPICTKDYSKDYFDNLSRTTFTIYVKSDIHKQSFEVKVDATMDVEELKDKIQQRCGMPAEQMKLMYGGTPLECGRRLGSQYQMRPEDTVFLA